MPAPIEASIKTKVIQQWLSGDSRSKIAIDNNVGEGTVGSIVNYFKIGLDQSEFDAARELALQAKKQGLNLSDLASNFRLHNFIKALGVSEDQMESFLSNISSTELPPEKIIEIVNQIYEISNAQSVTLDKLPNYIKQKLVEKQGIDEQIQQADAILQTKNVAIENINEFLKLGGELEKHGLSTHDIHKLLNVLINAKKYGFDGKEIAEKLYNFKFLEWKEKELKDKRKKLSKRISKYKDVVPLIEDIAALGIGIDELLALKVVIKEAAKHYNLPFVGAALRLIDDIKSYNKINGLKRELDKLSIQKYTLDQACSRQSKSLIALARLKSYGMTEERILELLLENNGYEASSSSGKYADRIKVRGSH
jgi:hypothetical protein